MNLPNVTALELEHENGWLTIWFNQPDRRNALSEALIADLLSVLEAVRPDRTVRGITLRGRGGVFCAGGDLKAFRDTLQSLDDTEAVIANSRRGARIFDNR